MCWCGFLLLFGVSTVLNLWVWADFGWLARLVSFQFVRGIPHSDEAITTAYVVRVTRVTPRAFRLFPWMSTVDGV